MSRSKARKNKDRGVKGQNEVRSLILDFFPELEPDDCRCAIMGSNGEDLLLSPAARKLLGWQVEVKRRKAMDKVAFKWVFDAIKQAEEHGDYESIMFFREDRGTWYACVDAKYLLELKRKVEDYEKERTD